MKALSASHEVISFPFDWRLSLLHEGKRFAELLDQHLTEKPTEPVRIVAHAMGGLIVRAALAHEAKLWERFKERHDSRIVLLGVPHGGTYFY